MLLLSNGITPGRSYLEHALAAVEERLRGTARRVAFLPYAQHDHDRHTGTVAQALARIGASVVGTHTSATAPAVIGDSDAVFVGGGNSFRLLKAMHELGLVDVLRSSVAAGKPYFGTSAGAVVASPTLRTTNDMPIVVPAALNSLGLVPFQINPHYPLDEVMGGHLGEGRDRRIAEFLEENEVPVVGLCEGSWLEVDGQHVVVGGVAGARVFQRGVVPVDVPVGGDLSWLLSATVRFDLGRARAEQSITGCRPDNADISEGRQPSGILDPR